MRNNRSKRPGVSLMMVTAVVAVASVMGVAMLSSSALQSEASINQGLVAQADALAESGINLGLYYLQNLNNADPAKCPAELSALTPNVGNYALNNQSLGTSTPGTFDVQFARRSDNQYQVTAAGKATATGATVQRTLTSVVDVNYFGYGVTASNASSASTWTIQPNTTINGDVYASCPIIKLGTVNGMIYANVPSGTVSSTPVPNTLTVNHYTTYIYNGLPYTAGVIVLTPAAGTILGPTLLNPAGVYTCATTIDLNGNVKINGTLIVTPGGSLRVQKAGNAITPLPGFPAIVVDGDISFKAANSTLDLNGLAYIGGKVTRTLSWAGCKLNVTGGLLCAGATVSLDSGVAIQIKYDRLKAAVSSLAPTGKPAPTSVSIVSWKN